MAKALRIGIRSPHELRLLKMLARGTINFDDLSLREKIMLYESNIDIRPEVSEEEYRKFENQMTLNNAIENENSMRRIVSSIAGRVKRRLQ